MKLWTWFKNFPWYVQVIFIIVLLFILYQLYKFIKTKIEAGNYNAAVSQAQTAINQLVKQGVNPSYGQAEYTNSANALQKIFDGCTLAEDSASGWDILQGIFNKMKNDADIYSLIKAYGVRTTDKCGLFTGNINADLSSTLVEHFSGAEQFLIRHSLSDINAILQKNGITFSF